MYSVYVLKSEKDGRLYIGMSEDVERRIQEHNSGKTRSIKAFLPFCLLYQEDFIQKSEALRRERQIKRSGKLRKEIKEGTYLAPSSIG